MAEILSNVGTLATTFFEIATQTVTWVMANPLALIGCLSMLVITGIGVARKLIRGV